MDQFNKTNIAILRVEIEAALQAVGAKHGISLALGSRITFSDTTFRCKLDCVILPKTPTKSILDIGAPPSKKEDNDPTAPVRRARWDANCYRWGLEEADFGRKFQNIRVRHGRATVKIVDCRPRNHKYPIIVKIIDGRYFGRLFKFPAATFRSA